MAKLFSLMEQDCKPEKFLSLSSAKQALRNKRVHDFDPELRRYENTDFGNDNKVVFEYRRYWQNETCYLHDQTKAFEKQDNFDGIVTEIDIPNSFHTIVARHLAGYLVAGSLYENELENGHRFSWASIIPQPNISRWQFRLGNFNPTESDLSAGRSAAIKDAVFLLGGRAADKLFDQQSTPPLTHCSWLDHLIDHYSLSVEHCFEKAFGFLSENKATVERIARSLSRDLVLDNDQISRALKG